ncbi:MAG: amino acid-binding protein [Rikenellaceae bacterium]
MKIEQLLVFLENKTGRINELVQVLSGAEINMRSFSLAESNEFGIMRIIVSDLQKAIEVLRNNKFMVSVTEVLCVCIDDAPGSMAKVLEVLTSQQIFIEYMYAFSQGNSAYVVIRPTNLEKALEILETSSCKLITTDELAAL